MSDTEKITAIARHEAERLQREASNYGHHPEPHVETGDIVVTKRSQTVLKTVLGFMIPIAIGSAGVAIDARIQMAALEKSTTDNSDAIGKLDAKLEQTREQARNDRAALTAAISGLDKKVEVAITKLDILVGSRRRQ